MNVKSLFNLEKIFSTIFNLKRYISWNLFSIIGLTDIVFFIWLIINSKNSKSDIFFVFYGGIYLIITRASALLTLLLFIIEKKFKFKIKQNIFMDNIVYNLFFLIGIIPFLIISFFVLFLLTSYL